MRVGGPTSFAPVQAAQMAAPQAARATPQAGMFGQDTFTPARATTQQAAAAPQQGQGAGQAQGGDQAGQEQQAVGQMVQQMMQQMMEQLMKPAQEAQQKAQKDMQKREQEAKERANK